MIGEIFLNFSGEKALNIHITRADQSNGEQIEISLEDRKTEAEIRLSKEQIAKLKAALNEF